MKNGKMLKTAAIAASVFALGLIAVACDGGNEGNDGNNNTNEPVTYAVTYSLNGGSGTLPTEGNKEAGEKFNLAASTGLTKEDHTFDGWSDGTTKYAAGAEYTMPSHAVTFTAQWKESDNNGGNTGTPTVKYHVTYSLNGGSGTLPTESDKAEGEKFNLAASTGLIKENHTFNGWSDGTTTYAVGAEYTMPAENVTLTAQWVEDGPATYTVTYRAGVGADGIVPAGGNYEVGNEVKLPNPSNLNKEGYIFSCWKDDESGATYNVGETFSMPAHNVSLTAQWRVDTSGVDPSVKYTVTVVKSSNENQIPSISGEIPNIENKAVGETFKIPSDTFTFEHYTITAWRVQKYSGDYWETLANYGPDEEIEMPETNIRIAPVWTANNVTISFNANGGSGTMANITKQYNTNMALTTSAFDCKFTPPTGKAFQGWATSPNGYVLDNGTRLDSSIVSANDTLTLYAIWETSAQPSVTIEQIAGSWTNGTDVIDIVSDNLGNEYAQGSGILNGRYLVQVFLGEINAIVSLDDSIYYELSINGSSLTLTPESGSAITFTSKTTLSNAPVTEFTGKWAKVMQSSTQPWVITSYSAYYNSSLNVAQISVIGSNIAIYYESVGYNYVYVLKKTGEKLTGYYTAPESSPSAVEFTAGTYLLLTVDGVPNQLVNSGSAPDATKITQPTAPEGKEFSKWVIKGTQTEFNSADVMTADVSIEAVFTDIVTSSVKTYVGSPDPDNGRLNKIVINLETGEITFTYTKLFGTSENTMQATATKSDSGYRVTGSDNPTGSTLWIVVSEDGNTITLHDEYSGAPDEQLGGAFTLQP